MVCLVRVFLLIHPFSLGGWPVNITQVTLP
jgi:hypothetical protein